MATKVYEKEGRGETVTITHVFSHMERKANLGSAESRARWGVKIKKWLEKMGDMAGMVIRGNEAVDAMAADAIKEDDQVQYVKLEEGGCHLYWNKNPFEEETHRVAREMSDGDANKEWRKALRWDEKTDATWSLKASLTPMVRPRHYEERVLNCLTRYRLGTTVLASQVTQGWGTERGGALPEELERWYGGGVCKWCEMNRGVRVQEHNLHMLALCPAYEELRVQAIKEVSALYRGLVGKKAQWVKWMGVDAVRMWTGIIPKPWYQKARRAAMARGNPSLADRWAAEHVLVIACVVTNMHHSRLRWMKEQGLFSAIAQQIVDPGADPPADGEG